jgi:hypothetical protein
MLCKVYKKNDFLNQMLAVKKNKYRTILYYIEIYYIIE